MPLKISEVGKILKTLNRFSYIGEFNENLPVKIEIKKQLDKFNYLIDLGNKKEIISKSTEKLNTGKYFAVVKEKAGNIQITNLKKIPEIFDFLEKTDFKEKHFSKEIILNHLAHSSNKTEFIFFMNMLMALHKKIYHYILKEKKALLQYKYQKNKIKFYALFNNLGEIEGEIYLKQLKIYSPFENTLNLIREYSDTIQYEVITILKKEIKPLFEFRENLINIKA